MGGLFLCVVGISNANSSSGNVFIVLLIRFCSSHLWTRQSLPLGKFPKALDERSFVVPGEAFQCHDSRRSLTDLQETSQWLGGQGVPSCLLEALTGWVMLSVVCWLCLV